MQLRKFSLFIVPCLSLLTAVVSAFAADPSTDRVSASIRKALQLKYPLARIELTSSLRWTRGQLPALPGDVRILGENGRGEVAFSVGGDAASFETSEASVGFGAWVPAFIALRRIQPGERIDTDAFVQQEVNVAAGQAREFRGVILSQEAEVKGTEARQTVLEGQFLVSTAVRKVPDVRKGDSVRVHLSSGTLIVNTIGTAEETGYLNRPVQVLIGKGKRLLVGELRDGNVVEVKL